MANNQGEHFTNPAPAEVSNDTFDGRNVKPEVFGVPPLPKPHKTLPESKKAAKLPSRGAYLEYSMMGKLAEILTDLSTITKQMVVEAPVSGLGLARQDLGARRGPKPSNKLPEAH